MGSRLGRRVISFANLPIKLLMPSSFNNINEIALKTIPSASKIEIKRVLESLYGFDVEKVSTLNMEGKKKKRGGLLIAKPDYKKAYVTLRSPLSISPELYPIRIIEEEKQRMNKQTKSSVVEDGEGKRHWLDEKARATTEKKIERFGNRDHRDNRDNRRGGVGGGGEVAKFPWSTMRTPATAEKKPEIFGKRDDRHRDRRGRGDVAKSPARGLERVKMSLVLAPHGLKPQQVICTSDRMRSSSGSGDVKFPWSSMRSPVTSEKKAERFGNRDRDRRGRGGE